MIGTGLDPLTALSAVAGAINNTGPGLNSVVASVASIGTFGKWVLIVAMLVGRLEVFTLLVLFTPAFWRRRRNADQAGCGARSLRAERVALPGRRKTTHGR